MEKSLNNEVVMDNQVDPNAYVSLKHIDKIYDNNVQAVFDFNLDIKKQEFIVFVGPSGCGKSTTLRMVAGLEDISAGQLWIDGVYSNDLLPRDRDIAMVFQSYALYPHMTVYDNMAFGLRVRHFPEEEINKRVHEAARILEIEQYLDRKPKALSGGQRQRVALGRAIVRNAKVFLMDEPLSNLDAKLRIQMRSEIIKLHMALKATTIYVTHDQTEAMTMATRIVVMKAGRVQQIGTPFEIYNSPANLFVAGFIGVPPMNFIPLKYNSGVLSLSNGQSINLGAEVSKAHDDFYQKLEASLKKELSDVEAELKELGVDPSSVSKDEPKEEAKPKKSFFKKLFKKEEKEAPVTINAVDRAKDKYFEVKDKLAQLEVKKAGGEVVFAIRPEDIHDAKSEEAAKLKNKIEIEITAETAELLGHQYNIHATYEGAEFICTVPSDRPILPGEKLDIVLNLDKIHIFDKITTNRIY